MSHEKDFASVDYNAVMKECSGFENIFDEAFVGIPASVTGSAAPFYGTLKEAKKSLPDAFNSDKQLTTVIYMEGSGAFSKALTFREWITGEADCIFFAPNSYQGKGRPSYVSPASKAVYEKVHKYRQAEIKYTLSRLNEIPFIDQSSLFLMGNSEGGVAAARYSGEEFKARIVLSWTCEAGYFTDFPEVGSLVEDPFLNIVGRDDEYFGKFSELNQAYKNEGHCGDALSRYKNAKIVLLPNTGHNVMSNPFTKFEVLSFIEMFKGI